MDRVCLASIELWVVCGRLLWEMTSTKQWGCAWLFQKGRVLVQLVIAPAGFWPLGQNPRRHPRIPRVYTYKEFQNVRK